MRRKKYAPYLNADQLINLMMMSTDLGELYNHKLKSFDSNIYCDKSIFIYKTFINDKGKPQDVPLFKSSFVDLLKDNNPDNWTNIFWLPNCGMATWKNNPYKHAEEGRKKENIFSYRAFFFDTDLKISSKDHYKGEELEIKKAEEYNKILQLPLVPDYIIESRNGFHSYYIIPQNEWEMSSELWHKVESGIFDFIFNNVSQNFDPQVSNSNRIIRVPYSRHKKADNDDFFQVNIKFIRNKDKMMAMSPNDYTPSMFAYSIEDLIKAFDININSEVKQDRKHTITKAVQTIKQSPKVNQTQSSEPTTNIEDVLLTKYESIRAIRMGDIEYFTPLRDKFKPSAIMTMKQATKYINSIDIREPLGLMNQPLDKNMSSLFYEDKSPSDYFHQSESNRVSYYCREEDIWYNSIINIIVRVTNFDESITAKEIFRYAYDFAYKMFGIEITQTSSFESTIGDNIQTFKKIIAADKFTHYLKAILPLYEVIMQLWKEQSDKYNTPYKTTYRDLSADFLKTYINKPKSWITRAMLILEYLNIIDKIEGEYQSAPHLNRVNRYRFPIIQDREQQIIDEARLIKRTFNKPLNSVSREKLNFLFNKKSST